MKNLIPILLILALLCGCTVSITPPPETTDPATVSDGESLTVHFIDVGQADCALLECGGEYMVVDGGNVEDGSKVVTYLQEQGVEELAAVVCSHAHEDHVGGLPAVLAVYPTEAVYAPTRTYSSSCFDDFVYYTDQQDLTITIPAPGDQFSLGGATVTVLGPTQSYAETNDTSIILRVDYGTSSFLFTGDMETAAEGDMLDYWGSRIDWDVDVLKVGHHGSDTSSSYRFIYETAPEYAVISVGEGNSYGHPHEEPLSRLQDAGCTIFRTDDMGTVRAISDGTDITFTWDDQSAAPDNAEPGESPADVTYIGNKNSKKFHSEDCSSLPSEKNQVIFSSYDDAVAAGYSPCGSCLG